MLAGQETRDSILGGCVETAGQMLKGQGGVGLAVKGIEDKAIGEALPKLSPLSQAPDRLCGQSRLTNSRRPAESYRSPRL